MTGFVVWVRSVGGVPALHKYAERPRPRAEHSDSRFHDRMLTDMIALRDGEFSLSLDELAVLYPAPPPAPDDDG
jgi:hypothetical protein